MTNFSKLMVLTILAGLTIGPVSWAKTKPNLRPRVASAKTNSQFQAEATSQSDSSQVAPKRSGLVGPTESLLFLAPGGGEFLMQGSLRTQTSESKTSQIDEATGISYKSKSKSTTNSAEFNALYGLNDNFYLGGSLNYQTSDGSADRTITSGFGTIADTKSSASGLSEPKILAGYQNGTSSTRFIGQISVTVPTGDSKAESKDNKTTSDQKAGGSDITPQVLMINNFGFAKLISGLSHKISGEKKTDYTLSSSSVTVTESGGDTTTALAGMEFPRALNTGFVAAYSRSYTSERKRSDTGLKTSDEGATAAALTGYMGIPLSLQAMLVPQLAYLKILDKSVSGVDIENNDAVSLSVNFKLGF